MNNLFFRWNADETGIVITDREIYVATSRKQIRTQMPDIEHVTAMLTTNAAGSLAPTLLLFPDSVRRQVSTSILSQEEQKNVVLSRKESAYMDSSIFSEWLIIFLKHLSKKSSSPNLLIVDGHKSRINVNTLITAATHNLHLICLPSNLTHLLQPNDAYFNATFKAELKKVINEKAEGEVKVTYAILTLSIAASLKLPSISKSIVSSYRKTGIWLVDQSKVHNLVALERPKEGKSEVVEEVVRIVEEKREIRKRKKEIVEELEREVVKRRNTRKGFFSTSHSQVLTSSDSISLIRLDNDYHSAMLMSIENLKEWVKKQPEYTNDCLTNLKTGRQKTRKDINQMIFSWFSQRHQTLDKSISTWMEKEWVTLPPTSELLSQTTQEVNSEKNDQSTLEGERIFLNENVISVEISSPIQSPLLRTNSFSSPQTFVPAILSPKSLGMTLNGNSSQNPEIEKNGLSSESLSTLPSLIHKNSSPDVFISHFLSGFHKDTQKS